MQVIKTFGTNFKPQLCAASLPGDLWLARLEQHLPWDLPISRSYSYNRFYTVLPAQSLDLRTLVNEPLLIIFDDRPVTLAPDSVLPGVWKKALCMRFRGEPQELAIIEAQPSPHLAIMPAVTPSSLLFALQTLKKRGYIVLPSDLLDNRVTLQKDKHQTDLFQHQPFEVMRHSPSQLRWRLTSDPEIFNEQAEVLEHLYELAPEQLTYAIDQMAGNELAVGIDQLLTCMPSLSLVPIS